MAKRGGKYKDMRRRDHGSGWKIKIVYCMTSSEDLVPICDGILLGHKKDETVPFETA